MHPPHDRAALASAYVAKAVLGLTTTTVLIERLTIERALKRICEFTMWKALPGEATPSTSSGQTSRVLLQNLPQRD